MDLLLAVWKTSVAFAPYLLLGTLLSGLLHVVVSDAWLRRQLHGRMGVVKAALIGIPLPLCSCGVIPAGLSLHKAGASRGATVSFMLSTPQTGVDSLLVSASMLGWPFALGKVLAALVSGVLGGWLTDVVAGRGEVTEAAGVGYELEAGPPLRRAMGHMGMLLRTVWPWLLVGMLLSAALELYVPPTLWTTVGAMDPHWAVLAVLLIAAPLYVCTVASVPIAAALLQGGMPAGAALVFLMAGPATNAATLGAVYRTLGLRTTALYLGVVTSISVGIGLLCGDWLLPARALPFAHVHGATWWAGVAAIVLWGLLARFAAEAARALPKKLRQRTRSAALPVRMPIAGLRCGGCVRKLQRSLEQDGRLSHVRVTLEPPELEIVGDLSSAEVAVLVEQAGFRPGSP